MEIGFGSVGRITGIALLSVFSAVLGSVLSTHFGTSSYTISYADFVSIMLTALGVMMTVT